jgi:hypothetical protein
MIEQLAQKIQAQSRLTNVIPRIQASAQYKTQDITPESFIPVTAQHYLLPSLWIDGGNATILNGTQTHVSCIRISAVHTRPLRPITHEVYEWFVLLTRMSAQQSYSVQLFAQTPATKELSQKASLDESFLKDCTCEDFGSEDVDALAGHIRRLLELVVATTLTTKETFVVLDGTLKCHNQITQQYIEALYKKPHAALCALAKTSRMMLESGHAVSAYLRQTTGVWYVEHVISSLNPLHKAVMTFVSLHSSSAHVFRLDIARSSSLDVKTIVAHLVTHSQDAQFHGYPYPLIKADSLARVTKQEQSLYQTQLLAYVGNLPQIQQDLHSVDAHGILDKLQF